MSEGLYNSDEFTSSLGKFVIEFSKFEFAIAELASWTSGNIHDRDDLFRDCIRDTLEKNRRRISDYIKKHLPEIQSEWTTINDRIGKLNKERRFLVHGMIDHSEFIAENLAVLVSKGLPETNQIDSHSILLLRKEIMDIMTGKNGVNGEFYIKFVTLRIDYHNEVISKGKIVYKVNNEILTDWKGN